MATEKRQPDTALASRLFEEFYRFTFYRAVNLLEKLAPTGKRLGETLDPSEEPVRFSVKPGLSFPPSDISKIKPGQGKEPPRMEVRFLGLIGPSGVLPDWFNDLAMSRIQAKDSTLVDFLDIFHHRLLSLFYLAWKRSRFTVNYRPGANDRLSWYLLSLIGLGTDGLKGRIGLPEESLLYCSGLLGRQIPSAAAVESAIKYMSGVNAEVHQFIEREIPLDPGDLTRIGSTNAMLGESTICGSYVSECQTKFRIHLGPVTYAQLNRFLLYGDLLKPMFALIRYMVGIEYEFEIRVFLKAAEVPVCTLGGPVSPDSPRLGLSTWMITPGFGLKQDPYVTVQEGDLD